MTTMMTLKRYFTHLRITSPCVMIAVTILWLCFLILIFQNIFRLETSTGTDALALQLNDAHLEMRKLRDETARLLKVVDEQAYMLKNVQQRQQNNKFDGIVAEKIADAAAIVENKKDDILYSKEHEVSRRNLHNNVLELYFYLSKAIESNRTIAHNWKAFSERVIDQSLALVAESSNFADIDQAAEWHKRELGRLTEKIQSRLVALQNPENCETAKILLCDLNKGCGFGCQLHHVAYCFTVAAASNRTLVFENDGSNWRYSSKGWQSVFQPVGSCKDAHAKGAIGWQKLEQTDRVVRLPIVDGLISKPDQLPLSFPSQLEDKLLTHHTNPPVYFAGQFISYLMRSNEKMQKIIDEAASKVPFGTDLVVGVQIRRTDKIGTEAAFHYLEEYMKWVERWFVEQELRRNTVLRRSVLIATDDPSVFKEAREKYTEYKIYGDETNAQTAQMNSRYTDNSLTGVIVDIQLLARCDYLVCTFSSQVCRMGFELMQVYRGDAGHLFHSLDDIYYFGGQHPHNEIAVRDHKPADGQEFAFRAGDVIGIAGNHWDGWSKGTNRRTGKTGLYPSYKTHDNWRIVDFPLFNGI